MTLSHSPSSEMPPWRYRAADHPHIFPVRSFSDNYIWLVGLDNRSGERQALVVDPGDSTVTGRGPVDAEDEVAVFAALRQWKNEFRG